MATLEKLTEDAAISEAVRLGDWEAVDRYTSFQKRTTSRTEGLITGVLRANTRSEPLGVA